MDENLTDQQRAEQIRGWLRENGWTLLAGIALGLAGLFGWRQWDAYRSTESEKASALYEELLSAIRVDRTTRAEELAVQLAEEFGSTPYVDQARLAMAKMKLDRSLPDEAAKYLEQVADDASSPEIAHIARLRLGRVFAHQEKYEEALKVLDSPEDSAFAPRFHEVRGDIYYAMGRLDEARAEYDAALKADQPAVSDQPFLQAKRDALPGGTPPATDALATTDADTAASPASN